MEKVKKNLTLSVTHYMLYSILELPLVTIFIPITPEVAKAKNSPKILISFRKILRKK